MEMCSTGFSVRTVAGMKAMKPSIALAISTVPLPSLKMRLVANSRPCSLLIFSPL